jgi:hypothetical protein
MVCRLLVGLFEGELVFRFRVSKETGKLSERLNGDVYLGPFL